MDAAVVGDVIAVVTARRGVEGQQPDGGDAQLGDVVELLQQALEVADAVIVGIEEGLDVQLVDDSVFVPQGIVSHGSGLVHHIHDQLVSGWTRQSAKGKTGSSVMRCHLPDQASVRPAIKSATVMLPLSGTPHL